MKEFNVKRDKRETRTKQFWGTRQCSSASKTNIWSHITLHMYILGTCKTGSKIDKKFMEKIERKLFTKKSENFIADACVRTRVWHSLNTTFLVSYTTLREKQK